MSTSQITIAFAEAAAKLGFSFEPAFLITLTDEVVIKSAGLVRHYGSKLGTLLFSESEHPTLRELEELRGMGYYYSLVFESYHQFEEQHFKDTLNDWGYFGNSEERPDWYSAKS